MYTYTEQREIKDAILAERLKLIGPIMQEENIDGWLIISKEYGEDLLFHTLTPVLYKTARRITILAFFQKDGVADCVSVSLPDPELEKYYRRDYDSKNEGQFEALARVIKEHDAKVIAINTSDNYAFSDGLTYGLYRTLQKELPSEIVDSFVSSDAITIKFLETRTDLEQIYMPMVMDEAMKIIYRAFSTEVITPGVTTCRDVMDFMEEEVNKLGIETWFESTINLQNENGMLEEDTVIQKGDLVHCDFGIKYLNLCTDTQRLCYICKDGEDDLPEELKLAMKRNNRFQDIVRSNMIVGRTGNEVFTNSIKQGKEEGLRPILYTHPLGIHGHGAGPTIGLWSDQNEIPVKGDLVVHNNTGWALELSIVEYLEMYHRDTFIFTEESVLLKDGEVHFLADNRDKITVLKGN